MVDFRKVLFTKVTYAGWWWLEHDFYFSICWIFFRGVGIPPTSMIYGKSGIAKEYNLINTINSIHGHSWLVFSRHPLVSHHFRSHNGRVGYIPFLDKGIVHLYVLYIYMVHYVSNYPPYPQAPSWPNIERRGSTNTMRTRTAFGPRPNSASGSPSETSRGGVDYHQKSGEYTLVIWLGYRKLHVYT